jgi:hypothetical protein
MLPWGQTGACQTGTSSDMMRSDASHVRGPQTAFTFNFNATGASNGDLMSSQITSGYDNTGAPEFVFSPEPGSGPATTRAIAVGVTQSLAACLGF